LCNDKGKEKGALKFDADKVPSGAVLRYRKEGDVFKKFGGGTKSLGDYMTDKKIPLRLRDKIPVLAFGNDILFIAGVEISDKIKIDGDTKRIVKIRLIEPLFDN
ncbi:MAG: tRNA lysidine(34) synthetase TilS, partial [Clostridiales bacterium]|nr:tRNA lysidine(34) synthetase TilS [Clostridiales bacterium]